MQFIMTKFLNITITALYNEHVFIYFQFLRLPIFFFFKFIYLFIFGGVGSSFLCEGFL